MQLGSDVTELPDWMTRVESLTTLSEEDLDALAEQKIHIPDGGKYDIKRQKKLADHLSNILVEFHGKTLLEFLVVVLIVHIRRHIDAYQCFNKLEIVIVNHQEKIVKGLSSRWLVSIADTFIDYSEKYSVVSDCRACTILVNTVKLYETERLITGDQSIEAFTTPDRPRPLFDGLTSFQVGRGDMVFNLMKRIYPHQPRQWSEYLLQELLRRMVKEATVFQRFAEMHYRTKTDWRIFFQEEQNSAWDWLKLIFK
jgi:hypothetical protein